MAQPLPRLDQFAELIAGAPGRIALTPAEAASRMGLAERQGNAMLQRIRALLGWQAR